MKIDRVEFYVENAAKWRDWFVCQLGFQALTGHASSHTRTEIVKNGDVCFFLGSPLTSASPVAKFLDLHPPGVADVAFRVEDLEAVMAKAVSEGVKVLQPMQRQPGKAGLKWAKIAAWGSLSHTLIEAVEPPFPTHYLLPKTNSTIAFSGIDHIVLNVNAGDLDLAVAWYQNILGFRCQQKFNIQTDRSGLHSQVLLHPSNSVQFPINEPASGNSQIQEFLELNQGPGIQHIALQTPNIVQAIERLRNSGLSFIEVPSTYYDELQLRQYFPLSSEELREIAQQQILLDWQIDASLASARALPLLLQTFTQPIFDRPTFFFELIERRVCYINGKQKQAEGFGEGNFRALFEAIEREQMKRGTLETRNQESFEF